jgi:YVTN family beta-propeller protein
MKSFTKFMVIAVLIFTFSSSFSAATKNVNLKIFPSEYTIQIDGKPVAPRKITQYLRQVTLTHGEHFLLIKCDGYRDKNIRVNIDKSVSELEIKLEKSVSVLEQVAVVKTGMHPKSVEFTPDGKYFASALLEGSGVDLFSTAGFSHVKRIEFPDNYGKKRNFVEIVFLPERNEMWVSQMATNSIHVVDMKDFTYKLTIPSRGVWTKIIAVTPDGKTAFASNWESHDISVIDVEKHSVVKKIKVAGIPRGMVVTNDSRYLYVCIFSNGQIQKIDIPSMKIVKTMNFPHGAKRHILLDRKRNIFYVTDMYRGSVYVINGADDKVIKEVPVDKKLNTAKLSGDGKYLYVSSRGPNNPETYLKKGPVFGKVFVIDTETFLIKDWIWGRNQPTGLDLSPDGRYMAFTNFLDDEVEVYRINIKK